MSPWKVILATLVIFVAGAVAGISVGRRMAVAPPISPRPAVGTNQPGPAFANRALPTLLAQRQSFLQRVQRQLDLTVEQREQIERLMRESQQRLRPVVEKIGPEMREEFRRSAAAIREVLTEAQQSRFDELMRWRVSEPEAPRRRLLPNQNMGAPTHSQ